MPFSYKPVSFTAPKTGLEGSTDPQDAIAMQQQQALADMLTQQAQNINYDPRGHIGVTQGLAQMLQAYAGGKARDKVQQLAGQLQQRQQDAIRNTAEQLGNLTAGGQAQIDALPGSPATPITAHMMGPQGQQQPNAQDVMQQSLSAVGGLPQSQQAQVLGGALLNKVNPPTPKDYDLAPGATRVSGATNQPLYQAPVKPTNLQHTDSGLTFDPSKGTFQDSSGRVLSTAEVSTRELQLAKARHDAVSTQQDHPTMDPDTVHNAAIDVLADPKRISQYAGFGQSGQDAKISINNEKTRILKAVGLTEDQVIRQQAIAKAQVKSIGDLVAMQNAVGAYETVAKGNGDRVLELVNKVNTTGVPILNSAKRIGEQAMGSPDAAELMQVLHNYQTEVARIIQNPRLVGQLTDTARDEIKTAVPANLTPAQAKQIVGRLNFEFELRKRGLSQQIESAQGQLVPGFGGGQPGQPSAVPSAPMPLDVYLKSKGH